MAARPEASSAESHVDRTTPHLQRAAVTFPLVTDLQAVHRLKLPKLRTRVRFPSSAPSPCLASLRRGFLLVATFSGRAHTSSVCLDLLSISPVYCRSAVAEAEARSSFEFFRSFWTNCTGNGVSLTVPCCLRPTVRGNTPACAEKSLIRRATAGSGEPLRAALAARANFSACPRSLSSQN